MSLSKAALNMAEALRPVLVKLIPQKMLSAVKANHGTDKGHYVSGLCDP